ncbi:MAG: hypothetical protein ACM3ML_16655 [Micromonosporaceae bacterium]
MPAFLDGAGEVVDAVHRRAVVVGHDPALPNAGGHLVLGRPCPLSHQVARFADSAASVDADRLVAEEARGEHGDRDEWRLGRGQRQQVRGQAHLGDIELVVAKLPVKGLLDAEGDEVEVDPLRADAAVREGPHPVVVPARERQRELAHRLSGWIRPLPPGPDLT